MPDPKPKLVKVDGLGTISFPGDMPDEKISASIKKHLSSSKDTGSGPHNASVSAYEPSFLDTAKSMVRNTPLGRAAHDIAPRVTDYLGVSPSIEG